LSKYKQHLKQIVTWVLLALIVLLWVQFMLFPKHQTNDIQAVTAPPSQFSDATQIPKLSSYHIFGSSSTSEIPFDMLQSESSLDLIITGIFSSNDPTQGRAYIRSRQGDEKKFMVGDDVFGLAELAAIHDNHLILRRAGGKNEKLSLNKSAIQSTATRSKVASTDNAKNETSSARIANHINQSSDWQEMLDKQKFDPNKIRQLAGKVSIVKDGQGQIAGLRVSQLASSSTMVKQGLKSNDQIVAVNGVDISYQNILSLQQQLQSNGDVSVTVMRNGRRMNLNLNLSEFQ
jgi:type II secretion system protein C